MNSRPLQIVATESVPPSADLAFAHLGPIAVDNGQDPTLLSNADVLIVRTRTVDRTLLNRAARLRVIARTGAGVDGVDLEEASKRLIPVLYAPDAGTLPIAEGTLALILATTKRLFELREVLTERRWSHRYASDIRDLAGTTVGIVGLGRIGSEVARLSHALGMHVIAYDPLEPDPRSDGHRPYVRRVSLDELVREADVVTLHCGLNETSRGMIDRDLLSRVKPGAILINASRGGLVASDEILLEALDQGWLSAIGLDVFTAEPPDHESLLLRDPRIVCTPHAIGLTRAWNERVFRSLADDVESLLNGGEPRFIANPDALAASAR